MKGRAAATETNTPQSDSPPSSFTSEISAIQLGPPMSIQSLPGCNQGAHLIQFEVKIVVVVELKLQLQGRAKLWKHIKIFVSNG